MNRLTFLLVVLISFMAVQSYAQEVCNNGIDDDGDGFIDCYDGSCSTDPACDGFYLGNDAACQVPPPTFPQFTMALDFSSPNETTNHLSRIAIGDLDRDGVPEIITMNKYTDRIFILNGNNGSIKVQKTVSWDPAWEIAIANLDNDNCAEIFFLSTDNRIRAYDCGLNLIWTSTAMLGDPINYGLADFDGDGKVELYCKDQIFDAHTGTRIIKTKATKSDNSIDDDNWRNINGGPVAVDIVGDSKLELV
ncbi:MAG: FG-GAP repeat domain-containing protein, partial [Bacteroidota bacterium]